MCTNLSNLFACIRAQGNSDADATTTSHQRHNEDVDDEAPGSRWDLQQQIQRVHVLHKEENKSVAQQHALSLTLPVVPPLKGCNWPPSRDVRVSHEALERYDQIFESPTDVPAAFVSDRNIPGQF
ncbi:uncharacterized protein LOC119557840 [Drosophila subpulchrella]|uniref:uncharacterized protein LOC119557840 n=1 Tax=Drosophila subpulchrella TaxID=1486046 RepID=UPI0018A146F7|nr:uncharacterized protein LOC119557840 [Drosophila subpulchrella]